MIKQKILEDLKKVINQLGYPTTDIVCNIPKNPAFGDYSTNLALQLAKQKSSSDKQNPIDIANKIIKKLKSFDFAQDNFYEIKVAGGGFINFFIKGESLVKNLDSFSDLAKHTNTQKTLVEYGHVNPLKEIHIGHLRTFILGESICRILESLGNQVYRANYQGDIGLHIAKAIWGIKKIGLPTENLSLGQKASFLGKAYADGNNAYENDIEAKKQIENINVALYQKEPELKELYELTRNWSLEYFEPIYESLGIKYDRCFFESEVFEKGKRKVLEHFPKLFEKNEGAIIFPGEKYGLHTRAFINSAGNPTYEGKDMGLAKLEYDTFNYDSSIHVVASEQEGYFQVIFKAIEILFPYLKGKKYHLSYGLVDLKEGKMSSRTGNVVTVNDLVGAVSEKVREIMKANRLEVDQTIVKQVALGAIKFAYLK